MLCREHCVAVRADFLLLQASQLRLNAQHVIPTDATELLVDSFAVPRDKI